MALSQLTLRPVQPVQTLLENRVFTVPQPERKAQPLMIVPGAYQLSLLSYTCCRLYSRDTRNTVLAPAISPARGHLERKAVPRIAIRRVILANRSLSISPHFCCSPPIDHSPHSPIDAPRHTAPTASSAPRTCPTGPACAPRPSGTAARDSLARARGASIGISLCTASRARVRKLTLPSRPGATGVSVSLPAVWGCGEAFAPAPTPTVSGAGGCSELAVGRLGRLRMSDRHTPEDVCRVPAKRCELTFPLRAR